MRRRITARSGIETVLHFFCKAARGEIVPTPASANETWRFGVFEVDTRRLELCRSGIPIKLREQSFLILVYLLEHAGEIVTREELRRLLWPSDTYVDFEHSLNTAVMKLREALGDSTGTPLYIETIPKRGYRFIAPVSHAADMRNGLGNSNGDTAPPPMGGTSGAQQAAPASAETPVRLRRIGRIAAVLGLIALAAFATIVYLRTRLTPAPAANGNHASASFRIVPLTTAHGIAIRPAFSPNGAWVAYIWDGPERKHFDLYVQLVGSDKPLRITDNKSGFLGAPAWSPDATEIAFTRCDSVYVVPALGGNERKLTGADCRGIAPGPLAWLSDGTGMLMIDRCSATRPFGVLLFSFVTGKKRCLTDFDAMNNANCYLTFSLSPDGRTIAFTVPTAAAPCLDDIYTISLSGGAPHPVMVEGNCACSRLMWTPDGKSIIFSSTRTTLASLWRVSANGGPVERETTYPAVGSLSKDGRRLVYANSNGAMPPAIWRADLAAAGGPALKNRELIQTQYWESDAQPSPDGTRIVWGSYRTGLDEIWTSGATGGSPLQLTHVDGFSGTPRWSPDGQWIAFDSYTRTGSRILVVDAEGRNQHSITAGPYKNVVPSWSRDGKSIYFASNRTGSWQVWKHALQNGAETQLTQHGGFDAFESYDGETIYFSRFDQAGIWSIPVSGGAESMVMPDKRQIFYWGHWAVTQTGLYVLNADAEPRPRIEFFNFSTRRTTPVLTLEKRPVDLSPDLSATADGRTVYYGQCDCESVLKLMEISH
jgi:Tol biopolymer transport system component/DNA-binding winged helix-turn-helix (wHTH) protein